MSSPIDNIRWPQRYSLVMWCFGAVFVCYIDRVSISVAALAMQEQFKWPETLKGMVLSSFFVGYLLFQVPSGYFAHRFGGPRILGIAVAAWSVFTLLTPIAAITSIGALISARIAMGIGEASMFPATFAMLPKWVPRVERSRSISIIMSGIPVGTLFGLAVTGLVIEYYSWPATFYLFGTMGVIWATMWFVTGERAFTKPPAGASTSIDVPWRRLLVSPAIWAVFVNHFCSNWTLYMLLAWLPSYFHAQGYSVANSGARAAAPWLTNLVVANAGAWIADRLILRGINITRVRKIMQVAALLGSAAFLLMARNAHDPTNALLYMCGALGALGLIISGLYPNLMEVAPRVAGALTSVSNTIATLPGVVGIYVTGWLVSLTGTYSAAFLLAAGLNVAASIIWVLFANSDAVVD